MSIDDLIQQIDEAGYHIALYGPDRTKVTPAFVWEIRVFSHEVEDRRSDVPKRRAIFHGKSAKFVLELALHWATKMDGKDASDERAAS